MSCLLWFRRQKPAAKPRRGRVRRDDPLPLEQPPTRALDHYTFAEFTVPMPGARQVTLSDLTRGPLERALGHLPSWHSPAPVGGDTSSGHQVSRGQDGDTLPRNGRDEIEDKKPNLPSGLVQPRPEGSCGASVTRAISPYEAYEKLEPAPMDKAEPSSAHTPEASPPLATPCFAVPPSAAATSSTAPPAIPLAGSQPSVTTPAPPPGSPTQSSATSPPPSPPSTAGYSSHSSDDFALKSVPLRDDWRNRAGPSTWGAWDEYRVDEDVAVEVTADKSPPFAEGLPPLPHDLLYEVCNHLGASRDQESRAALVNIMCTSTWAYYAAAKSLYQTLEVGADLLHDSHGPSWFAGLVLPKATRDKRRWCETHDQWCDLETASTLPSSIKPPIGKLALFRFTRIIIIAELTLPWRLFLDQQKTYTHRATSPHGVPMEWSSTRPDVFCNLRQVRVGPQAYLSLQEYDFTERRTAHPTNGSEREYSPHRLLT